MEIIYEKRVWTSGNCVSCGRSLLIDLTGEKDPETGTAIPSTLKAVTRFARDATSPSFPVVAAEGAHWGYEAGELMTE